jgi:small multidrug resistance family-3 protein
MRVIGLFVLAGVLEIGGGYLVWLWLRQQRSAVVSLVAMAVLALHGMVPTFQPAQHPFGRVYAAYGAVFIALAALWGRAVDKRPDLRDGLGNPCAWPAQPPPGALLPIVMA